MGQLATEDFIVILKHFPVVDAVVVSVVRYTKLATSITNAYASICPSFSELETTSFTINFEKWIDMIAFLAHFFLFCGQRIEVTKKIRS